MVQLVHIEGPLKGEIQEFSDPVISIGRHPSSHIRFPTDQTAVSRNHAEIIREGNRFRLVDRSTNGTFVNPQEGKPYCVKQTEAYLEGTGVLWLGEDSGLDSPRAIHYRIKPYSCTNNMAKLR